MGSRPLQIGREVDLLIKQNVREIWPSDSSGAGELDDDDEEDEASENPNMSSDGELDEGDTEVINTECSGHH